VLEVPSAIGAPDLGDLLLAAGDGETLGAERRGGGLAALPGPGAPDLGAEIAELLGVGDARASTLVDARIRG